MSENDTIGSDSDATTTPAASTGTDDGSTTSNTRSDDQGRHDTATVEGATNPDEPSAVTGDTETDPGLLEARLEVLREENERLRREYARARRSQYRRTAIGLGVLGTLAAVAAILFPEQSPILLALGGTGLFGAVLTYYLTPEQFVPATVGERIHRAHTANQAALIDDLGLQDDRLYVPTPERETMARLFVPQRADHELPPADVLDHLLVVTDDPETRGAAFTPTGEPLYEEFERTVTGTPASEPAMLAAQLADAVVETFELAESATSDMEREGTAMTINVTEPVYGTLDDPDHPVVSVLATGLAVGLERPVSVTVRDVNDATGLVVCEFLDDS